MPTRVRGLALLGLVFMMSGCASAAKLARQSNEALAKGDVGKAYDKALDAIEKDPQHQAARAAYVAASGRAAVDYRTRVVAAATGDTVAAANLALEYRRFWLEVARHETALDPAPDYAHAERAILSGAARVYYRRGVEAMDSRRPKVALGEFLATRRFDSAFADVTSRLEEARRAATVRVAVLPFTDRVGAPGVSQEVGDIVQREISNRAAGEFRFTQVVSAAEIEQNMTVAELRNLRFEDASDIGRRIGADWIVVGRFRGMRGKDSQRSAKLTLYRRVDYKDSTGATLARWDAMMVPVVTRLREVTVQYEFDVIDVETGVVLAHHEQPAQSAARIAWTDFRSDEHYDRYALLPPDVRRSDPTRAKAADAEWRDHMGSWDLKEFLRRSRDDRGRSRYSSRYRGEFYGDTRGHPVWLGELPSEAELVFVALHDLWRPVLAALKELDRKD